MAGDSKFQTKSVGVFAADKRVPTIKLNPSPGGIKQGDMKSVGRNRAKLLNQKRGS